MSNPILNQMNRTAPNGLNPQMIAQIKGIIHEYQYFQSTSTCSNEYKGTDATDGVCYFTATNAIFAS